MRNRSIGTFKERERGILYDGYQSAQYLEIKILFKRIIRKCKKMRNCEEICKFLNNLNNIVTNPERIYTSLVLIMGLCYNVSKMKRCKIREYRELMRINGFKIPVNNSPQGPRIRNNQFHWIARIDEVKNFLLRFFRLSSLTHLEQKSQVDFIIPPFHANYTRFVYFFPLSRPKTDFTDKILFKIGKTYSKLPRGQLGVLLININGLNQIIKTTIEDSQFEIIPRIPTFADIIPFRHSHQTIPSIYPACPLMYNSWGVTVNIYNGKFGLKECVVALPNKQLSLPLSVKKENGIFKFTSGLGNIDKDQFLVILAPLNNLKIPLRNDIQKEIIIRTILELKNKVINNLMRKSYGL